MNPPRSIPRGPLGRALRARPIALALLLCAAAVGVGGAQGARGADAESSAPGPAVRIPAEIPVRRAGERTGAGSGSLRGLVIGLTMLVALAVVTARLKKAGAGSGENGGPSAWLRLLSTRKKQDRLQVVESVRLTPRSSLHVVRWDGRELLVASGDSTISVLGSSVTASSPPGPDVASVLAPLSKGEGT